VARLVRADWQRGEGSFKKIEPGPLSYYKEHGKFLQKKNTGPKFFVFENVPGLKNF